MEIPNELCKTIPKSAVRVIEGILIDLTPTVERVPEEVEVVKRIIIDSLDYIVWQYHQSNDGVVPLSYLSSQFFEFWEEYKGTIAGEEMLGIAQVFGVLTNQKEGGKYYPRSLDLQNYGHSEISPDHLISKVIIKVKNAINSNKNIAQAEASRIALDILLSSYGIKEKIMTTDYQIKEKVVPIIMI